MLVMVNLDNDLFIHLVKETPDGGDISATILDRLKLGGWKEVNTGHTFGNPYLKDKENAWIFPTPPS